MYVITYLNQIDVIQLQSCGRQYVLYSGHGSNTHDGRIHTYCRPSQQSYEWCEPVLLYRLLACQDYRTGTIVYTL